MPRPEDLFSGNLRFQEKIINFLTDFGEIGGTSGKTKLYSFIFYNVSGQIQKEDAKMISGDIQSDGKPIIRSGTQRSGSAATGGLHLSEIPQKPDSRSSLVVLVTVGRLRCRSETISGLDTVPWVQI